MNSSEIIFFFFFIFFLIKNVSGCFESADESDSTPKLIRHGWQLKTVGFLHWCLFMIVISNTCTINIINESRIVIDDSRVMLQFVALTTLEALFTILICL
jgi:hypothetical protein